MNESSSFLKDQVSLSSSQENLQPSKKHLNDAKLNFLKGVIGASAYVLIPNFSLDDEIYVFE